MESILPPALSGNGAPRAESPVACRVCAKQVTRLLDFGMQPLCNRFLKRPYDPEPKYPLRLGQCAGCGLLQLMEPLEATRLKPEKPLKYTEPESHLDQVADLISQLPGMTSDAKVCGMTAKDQSTVDRLVARGFHSARCLRTREDLGIDDPCAGIETIQQQIGDGVLEERGVHHGQYHVVIVRHVLEHAHQLNRFVAELHNLLAPGGFLVIEVPDFTASLLAGDYSTLWEEHVVYFTTATLSYALRVAGLSVRHVQIHPYVPENSLLMVATARSSQDDHQMGTRDLPSDSLARELVRGRQYATRLPEIRRQWREMLTRERIGGREVALLGAGHLGIMFLNLMELADVIDVAVDDDPEKCGRTLPGSHHLISSTAELYRRPIELCLLSISPEGEDRVLERHHGFVDRGGRFKSIFPSSRWTYLSGGRQESL